MPLRLALLGLLALAACADAPAPEAGIEVRAVFVEARFDGEAVRVNHEAIPGRMPAMVMDLRLRSPALIDGLVEGAAVRLTLDSTSLEVLGVEALPPGTDLALAPEEGGGAVFLPPE